MFGVPTTDIARRSKACCWIAALKFCLAVKRAEWLSVGEKNFQAGSSRMQTMIDSALCDACTMSVLSLWQIFIAAFGRCKIRTYSS